MKQLDSIIAALQKIFELITLAMNKFIQFKSQIGTIKGHLDDDDRSIDEDSQPVDGEEFSTGGTLENDAETSQK